MIEDSLLIITPQQLKHTNLIFLEHKFYKNKIYELEDIIKIQNEINTNLSKDIFIKESIIIEKDSIITNNAKLHYNDNIKLDTYEDINKKLIICGTFITITLGLLVIIN